MSKQYWFEACNSSVTDPRLARATTQWGVAVVSAKHQQRRACCEDSRL
jgi:hypothetical protein